MKKLFLKQSKFFKTYSKIVNVLKDEKFIQLEWDDQKKSNFHYIWLRDHCKCNKCIDSSSGQRLNERSKVYLNIKPNKLETKETLKIEWNDGHESEFNLKFLKENVYSPREFKKTEWKPLTKLEKLDWKELETEKGVWKWLKLLNDDGVAIIQNVPTELGYIEKVANKISYIRETIYGRIFDVISLPNATNIAYTSTELNPHMDLMYYEGSPGLQFLHCIKQEAKGGESRFLDIFHLALQLQKKDPNAFQVLSKVKLTFYKNDAERNFYKRKPMFQLDENGELKSINYSPMFEGPLICSENLIQPFYAAYQKFENMVNDENNMVKYLLKPAELASFNNRRVLHGRSSFDEKSGERHLQGCYIDADDFCSQYELYKRKFGGNDLKKFN